MQQKLCRIAERFLTEYGPEELQQQLNLKVAGYMWECVDTCSSLGICAERNAIFNMITNGEHKIKRVLAIMPDGKTGAPCGACRELMTQLTPGKYHDIEIMLDYDTERVVTLGELTPEWWI